MRHGPIMTLERDEPVDKESRPEKEEGATAEVMRCGGGLLPARYGPMYSGDYLGVETL